MALEESSPTTRERKPWTLDDAVAFVHSSGAKKNRGARTSAYLFMLDEIERNDSDAVRTRALAALAHGARIDHLGPKVVERVKANAVLNAAVYAKLAG